MMVDRDGQQLREQFIEAQKQLKQAISVEEKIAISNYIGNLFSALVCMGDTTYEFKRNKMFGGKKNYNKFVKKINIYDDHQISNFILEKDFHNQYMGEIVTSVEDELEPLFSYTFPDEEIKPYEVIDITSNFMDSIGQKKLFDELYNSGKIHSSVVGQSEDNLGFTLYNPVSRDTDIFVREFDGDFISLLTLVHELGHAYDLKNFNLPIEDYNEYFYMSFYGETISRLYERLLYRYLIRNNIKSNVAKDKLIDTEDTNHDYLLQAYLLSGLDDEFILSGSYIDCSEEVLVKKARKNFVDEETLRDFIRNTVEFDLSDAFTYAYGDVISMFLCDDIEKNGFNSDLMEYFMRHRKEKFNHKLIEECGFGTEAYGRLYKEEVKLIKK